MVENKSGRGILHGGVVIDATGDADIAYRAGAPCEKGGNWLSLWALQESLEKARKVAAEPGKVSLLNPVRVGADANGKGHPPGYANIRWHRRRAGHALCAGRAAVFAGTLCRQTRVTGRQSTGRPCSRSRCLQWRSSAQPGGLWDAPLWTQGRMGVTLQVLSVWRRIGASRVRYGRSPTARCCRKECTGLLVAGRCMSAGGDAWEVMRVIPPAAHTGQVAGIAARLALAEQTTPDALPPALVQAELRVKGIPLHIEDVLKGR